MREVACERATFDRCRRCRGACGARMRRVAGSRGVRSRERSSLAATTVAPATARGHGHDRPHTVRHGDRLIVGRGFRRIRGLARRFRRAAGSDTGRRRRRSRDRAARDLCLGRRRLGQPVAAGVATESGRRRAADDDAWRRRRNRPVDGAARGGRRGRRARRYVSRDRTGCASDHSPRRRKAPGRSRSPSNSRVAWDRPATTGNST